MKTKTKIKLKLSAIVIAGIFCAQIVKGQTSYSGTSGQSGCTPAAGSTSNCTYVGCGAGKSSNGSKINVAVGDSALYTLNYNKEGVAWNSVNVAVGNQALYSTQATTTVTAEGIQNTAIGAKSLRSNTYGVGNTAGGYRAGFTNATGDYLSIFGYVAGENNTGDYSTMIGAYSGRNTSSGGWDTYIAYGSGVYNTT